MTGSNIEQLLTIANNQDSKSSNGSQDILGSTKGVRVGGGGEIKKPAKRPN